MTHFDLQLDNRRDIHDRTVGAPVAVVVMFHLLSERWTLVLAELVSFQPF